MKVGLGMVCRWQKDEPQRYDWYRNPILEVPFWVQLLLITM